MRFAISELSQRLASLESQSIPRIILLNGNELLLIEEALDELRTALKNLGFSERLKYQLEAGFDWSQITGAGQAMSLFAERRVLELRVPKSLGVAGTKALVEYCGEDSEDLLIVIMPALDKRQRQAKWAKVVDGVGWVIDAYEITPQQFPGWLKQRLQSRSLRVEAGVVELLAEQLEGNLLAAAQEIDKLKVLADNGAVPMRLVTESLADQARFDVFALTDSCLLGNATKALRIKQRLQSEGVEPVIVTWSLVKEIRQLAAISAAVAQGQPQSMAFKQFRVWSKREPLVASALKRHNVDACYTLLQNAAKLDQVVKGQRSGDAWQQIEKLCVELCGINPVKQSREIA